MASSGFQEGTTSLARTLNEAPKAVKSAAGYHFILLQSKQPQQGLEQAPPEFICAELPK
jgi:hypothetical protein